MDYLYLAAGLVILVVGGEATLRGAIGLAQALGV
ncbi:MAG: sodium:calcium antiporter, partial [Rhodospirillaceae bacterium]|nr:sodium:calcium antiporter [Rhodospirillaceae bacterium]